MDLKLSFTISSMKELGGETKRLTIKNGSDMLNGEKEANRKSKQDQLSIELHILLLRFGRN